MPSRRNRRDRGGAGDRGPFCAGHAKGDVIGGRRTAGGAEVEHQPKTCFSRRLASATHRHQAGAAAQPAWVDAAPGSTRSASPRTRSTAVPACRPRPVPRRRLGDGGDRPSPLVWATSRRPLACCCACSARTSQGRPAAAAVAARHPTHSRPARHPTHSRPARHPTRPKPHSHGYVRGRALLLRLGPAEAALPRCPSSRSPRLPPQRASPLFAAG